MTYDPAMNIRLSGEISLTDWLKLREIAREHTPNGEPDARRARADVDRIRRALALTSLRAHGIEMQCFDCSEAESIKVLLTPEELARVNFTWMRK